MTRLAADIREMFREQFEFQELLLQMTRRDLMLRLCNCLRALLRIRRSADFVFGIIESAQHS